MEPLMESILHMFDMVRNIVLTHLCFTATRLYEECSHGEKTREQAEQEWVRIIREDADQWKPKLNGYKRKVDELQVDEMRREAVDVFNTIFGILDSMAEKRKTDD